ncbi:MAG: glycosyltransferase family 39 protein [Chloroflexi bacterium]|nr:glycosyltransferase family 39 protein [Chloroflexota bacterium]
MNQYFPGKFPQDLKKLGKFALLITSIIFGIVAQLTLLLAKDQPGFWDVNTWREHLIENSSPLPGLIFYALAGILFIRALRSSGETPATIIGATSASQSREPRFGFWITSLGLAGLTAFFTAISTGTTQALGFGIISGISIFLFFISVLIDERWKLTPFHRVIVWIKTHRIEILGLFIILLVAFFIRFWDLELHPYSFINDEGQMGQNGACLVKGTCIQLMETGWSQQPMLAFLPTGLSTILLGSTAIAVRIVSVILGTLAVLAVYLFTRETFDPMTAAVAASLLATLPVHVHFSRIGVDNIMDSLSTTLMMWLVFRGIKRGSTIYFLAAGILGGLCFYSYPGTRLAPLIGFFAVGYFGMQTRKFFQTHAHNILILGLAFTITAAPILGFFITHPESFSARMNSVGIFQNNIIQDQMSSSGNGAIEILTQQFMKSSLVFIVSAAPSNFFNSPKPYLTFLAAIFFMLGLAYMLRHLKNPLFMGIFIWFWAAIILGSTLTGGPPTSQRMLMSTSALAIITAIGITKTMHMLPKTGNITRWIAPVGLLAFIFYTGYQNINYYFIDYRAGHYFEDPTNELTYESAAFISPLHTSSRFYLIAEPDVPYLSFANFNYFSPDVEKSYFNEVTSKNLADLPKDKGALFIATSSRGSDLENLAHLIPGGEWHEFRRRYQPDQILFYTYKIDKQALLSYKP